MATENDKIRKLLEQMTKLNCKQEAAITCGQVAIDELTARVAKLEDSNACGNTNQEPAPIRTQGYVNWNSTHDVLKTPHWQLLSKVTNICGAIERGGNLSYESFTSIFDKMWQKDVNEECRFPDMYGNNLFINASNPLVMAEMLLLMEIKDEKDRRRNGLVERFLNKFAGEIHTRNSFEEKYGLKWVKPPKN